MIGAAARGLAGPDSPGFVLEDYVLYNLVRTAATYDAMLDRALKQRRLDLLTWRVLMLLDDKSPSSVSLLARRSVTKLSTLTRALDRMEAMGLIVRKCHRNDGRVVAVTMTRKAARTLRRVKAIGHAVFERALQDVTADEAEVLTRLLRRVRGNLERSAHGEEAGSMETRSSSRTRAPGSARSAE
jgi:DNA-binding MarR family transcriptional regulator